MNTKPVEIYAGHGGPMDGQSAIRYFSLKEKSLNLKSPSTLVKHCLLFNTGLSKSA